MKKRILCGLVLLAVFAPCGFVFLTWLYPQPRINRDTFKQIKHYMSEQGVQELLGTEGTDTGVYAMDEGELVLAWNLEREGTPRFKEWTTSSNRIVIGFDATGKAVVGVHLRAHETFWDRVRRFLRPVFEGMPAH
jgi:hypothetical protein